MSQNNKITCNLNPFSSLISHRMFVYSIHIFLCIDMPDVTARYLILLRFLGILIYNCLAFMSEELYLHQTFKDCVSDQYTHFGMFEMLENVKLCVQAKV